MLIKDARGRWCPMVQVGEGPGNRLCIGGVVTRGPGLGVTWNCCIADGCMMWRFLVDGEGFCGLAGKEGAI
jgi:hypothetical protein